MNHYRWNVSEFSTAYDQAAERVHPYYLELQQEILSHIDLGPGESFLVVDAGGGSGRLIDLILTRWPAAKGVVLDQSPAFLAIAERKLAPHGSRARCLEARLQDDWPDLLSEQPRVIVSMSAVHHLDPAEKSEFYRRCADCLLPGGVLLNGDEVRPEGDADYLAAVKQWGSGMQQAMSSGTVPSEIHPALRGWIDRNITQFGSPKISGDDCHETIAAQLSYLQLAGFEDVRAVWQKQMWALLCGRKPTKT